LETKLKKKLQQCRLVATKGNSAKKRKREKRVLSTKGCRMEKNGGTQGAGLQKEIKKKPQSKA